MHSSYINNIRILKPRRKGVVTRSFTITNSNCHSSLMPKESIEETPPPLIPHSSSSEGTTKSNDKWVPVYIVNVPPKNEDGNQVHVSLPLKVDNKETSSKVTLHPFEEVIVTESLQTKVNVSTENEPSPSNMVSCFLCPLKFKSVDDMQEHYLECHKHKKRVTKPLPRKIGTAMTFGTTSATENAPPEEGEPKCPICSIGFNTIEEVQEHMGIVHSYDCPECKNTFYTLFQFTDHKCVKVIRQKKPKLIKKKKIAKQQDPLALPLLTTKITSEPASQINYSTGGSKSQSVPIVLRVPVSKPNITASSKIKPAVSSSSQYLFEMPLQKTQSMPSNLASGYPSFIISGKQNNLPQVSNFYTVPVPSIDGNWKSQQYKSPVKKYSMQELTSKEMIRKKIDEVMRNPNLTLNVIPKEIDSNEEEPFTCGRCNVLCEDGEDFADHLEECLKLSNVSLVPSSGPARRILKLKSELIKRKSFGIFNNRASVNQSLLKELKGNVTGSDKQDLLQDLEKLEESLKSIRKEQIVEDLTIKRLKTKSNTLIKQPMVIIPLNNALTTNVPESRQIHKFSDTDDHYPDISITDKSNRVTWKFLQSGKSSYVSLEKPSVSANQQMQNSITDSQKVLNPVNKILIPLVQMPNSPSKSCNPTKSTHVVPNTAADKSAELSLTLKDEPISPPISPPSLEIETHPITDLDLIKSESCKETGEFIDEDVKMEVIEEVVDDKF